MDFKISGDEFEWHRASSWEAGKLHGLEECAKILLQKAGAAYQEGDDKHANLLRSLSREFMTLFDKRRQVYDEEYKINPYHQEETLFDTEDSK